MSGLDRVDARVRVLDARIHVMDAAELLFAAKGFDVWTMDHEGYGKSDRTEGNSDIASGVEDLKAAAAVVTQVTGQKRFHFLGESSGALRAAAFAQVAPGNVGRMVLAAHRRRGLVLERMLPQGPWTTLVVRKKG